MDKIKLIITDIDGTLTDGKYIVNHEGKISKSYNTRDFYAIRKSAKINKEVSFLFLSGSDATCDVYKILYFLENSVDIIKNVDTQYSQSSRLIHIRGCDNKLFEVKKIMNCSSCSFVVHYPLFDQEYKFMCSFSGLHEVAFIGDGENDIDLMQAINYAGGITAAPFDALPVVKNMAQHNCQLKGGEGCVGEFIEYLNKWNLVSSDAT